MTADAATAAVLAEGVAEVAPPAAHPQTLCSPRSPSSRGRSATARSDAEAPTLRSDRPLRDPCSEAPSRRRWGARSWFALAASLALLVGVGWGAVFVSEQLNTPGIRRRARPDRVRAGRAVGDGRHSPDGGEVTAHWSESLGKAVLVSDGLPRSPTTRPSSCGSSATATADLGGNLHAPMTARTTALLDGALEPGDVIAVTVEPAGGSPTGQPHVRADRRDRDCLSRPQSAGCRARCDDPRVAWKGERRFEGVPQTGAAPGRTLRSALRGGRSCRSLAGRALDRSGAAGARPAATRTGEVVDRLVAFTAEHGIDDIAELWSRSPARSLPGALWRLYLHPAHDPRRSAHRGAALRARQGARSPPPTRSSPAHRPRPARKSWSTLIDTILRGLFQGDFAVALDRAAAFCRVQASGASHLADDYEATEPERASALTTRALRLADYATDLARLRGAVAPRVADLSPQQGRKVCRAAERLSARSRSQRQKMEPGVTAARLFQCNRGLRRGHSRAPSVGSDPWPGASLS